MFDKLFGLEKDHKISYGTEVELLTTVYDEGTLAVIRSVLEGAGIPYLTKERGSGSAVRLMTGFSMFGTDIFVPADKLELAREGLPLLDGNEAVCDDEIFSDQDEK